MKECKQAAASILFQDKIKEIYDISLSHRTVSRRIGELADYVELNSTQTASSFEYYSLAIDESTDVSDTAQLAIFVRGTDVNFNITEEMLNLQARKDTTTGENIFQELKKSMARFNLKFNKLHGILPDGAPAMVGNKLDLIAKIKSEMVNTNLDKRIVRTSLYHSPTKFVCQGSQIFSCHVNSNYVY